MCLALPVQERCAVLPVPGRLNCAQCGFGHENRVYLSCAGVVSIIAVLLWQGMDQKIQSRRQLCHVTVLQDYRNSMTYRFPNSRKNNFATEPWGVPPRHKSRQPSHRPRRWLTIDE